MNPNIVKIAITGGPCGGKTKSLVRVREHYEKLGRGVFVIGESATELLRGGINPDTCGSVDLFESLIIAVQAEKDKAYAEAALASTKACGRENVLIISDRSVPDCRVYMSSDAVYEAALAKAGLTPVSARDAYDAVFHMVTAADGAADHYGTASNEVRLEDAEGALVLDRLVTSIWVGHPHYRMIDNSTDFEGKIERLIREIDAFLGIPEPLETERRFLIRYPDTERLASLPECRAVGISQTYLTCADGVRRVRRRGEGEDVLYFLTCKRGHGVSRTEEETRISRGEYEALLTEADPKIGTIEKTRYCLAYKNKYFEVDVYPFWNDRAIVEIELLDENEKFELPPDFDYVREITGDKSYGNAALAAGAHRDDTI